MSDARAATDAVVDLCRKTAHEHMPQVGYSWMAADRVLALCARIAADAARIRELEAAGRALLTCPAIADIASEDRDPEDVVAERKMRAALGSRRDG